jgi:hypothetical protein
MWHDKKGQIYGIYKMFLFIPLTSFSCDTLPSLMILTYFDGYHPELSVNKMSELIS